ncbi:MAG: aldose 1-epimerase family protein [Planctomycetota bacterium]
MPESPRSEQLATLTDVSARVWHDTWQHREPAGNWTIEKQTLRGGASDGVDLVTLSSGNTTVEVLPTRGMGIWKMRVGDVVFGWQSPVADGPVHPNCVSLNADGGSGWLRGFDELLCRCGLASCGPPCVDGTQELTLHGKIANTPAHRVTVGLAAEPESCVYVEGAVDEAAVFGPKLRLTTRVCLSMSAPRVHLLERIENRDDTPTEFQVLYHFNLGAPVLEEGCQLRVPARSVAARDAEAQRGLATWSSYPSPSPGYREQVFYVLPEPDASGRCQAVLCCPAQRPRFVVGFAPSDLPCLTVWKQAGGLAEGYVTGIEPGTSYPNPRPFEREHDRVPILAPGASWQTRITLEATLGELDRQDDRLCAPSKTVFLSPGLPFSPDNP